jgi:uncharacterized RDD family membrane protein YckC
VAPSTDKLTIDTPELIALELPLAGVGSRFLALAFDSLLQVIGAIIVILIIVVWGASGLFRNIGMVLGVLMIFFIYWGYFVFFEIIWNGQTPGKRLARIRVIKESGRPITALEAITRNLLRAVDMLPGMYAAGFVCMMLNSCNKRLGDFVAGTVVVHDKKVEAVSAIWNPGDPSVAANLHTVKITPEELLLIETYLNRRHQIDWAVRKKTARQIAAMIENKTGLERGEGQSDDAFLEAVARKVRDGARYSR